MSTRSFDLRIMKHHGSRKSLQSLQFLGACLRGRAITRACQTGCQKGFAEGSQKGSEKVSCGGGF